MTANKNTLAIIRTTSLGTPEAELVETLKPWFGDQIVLAVDARAGGSTAGGPPAVRIDDERLIELGLTPVSDWGLRCGDYFQITVAAERPEIKYFWMLEPDVYFNFRDIAKFFSPFEENEADLLAYGFGIRTRDWGHYRAAAPFFDTVYGCFYPVTRLSRRAIEYLRVARCRYGEAWARCPEDKRQPYANDEGFVCSCLAAAGSFRVDRLEAIVPRLFQSRSFTWGRLILREHVQREPAAVLHPVVTRDVLPTKLRRKLGRQALPLLSYYSDLVAEICDAETNSWFAERAAHLLRQRHRRDAGLPHTEHPWSEPVGPRHAFILERRRQVRWNRSRAADFTYHPVVHRKEINFTRVLPYAANYEAQVLTFVDTDRRQVLRDPFLFLSQYDHASYAVFAGLEDLPEALDAGETELVTFVFSIGRCGSTLISNLAKACGLISYSECDALLGLPKFVKPGAAPKVEALLRRTVGALLAHADGDPILIKMKSHSNPDIRWFTSCFPRARYVFLSRAIGPWCASFVQIFDWSAQQMFDTLRAGVGAHRHLVGTGRLTAFLRYEDIVAGPADAVSRLFGPETASRSAQRIAEVIGAESQAGLLSKKAERSRTAEARLTELRAMLANSPLAAEFAASPVVYDR